MPPIFDLRPVRAILAECRDLRRQARQFPAVSEFAYRRIRDNRRTLAGLRYNRACLSSSVEVTP